MQPERRTPTHPGEILLIEFLNPMGMTQVEFAAHLGIPIQRVNEIIKGKRGVTPETAWLLSRALGTTPEFWLSLQASYDLAKTMRKAPATVASLRERLRRPSRGREPEAGYTPRAGRLAAKRN